MACRDSVRLKIDRAKLHLRSFEAAVAAYLKSDPSEFVPNTNSQPNSPTFFLRQKSPMPSEIGLIAGDFFENLRSSLDYLVWELVLKAGNVPDKKNMFPICFTADEFKNALRGHRLKGVDPAAVSYIDRLQPYHDGKPDETSLGVLNELTNINKHRRLVLTELNSFSLGETLGVMDAFLKSGSGDLGSLVLHDTSLNREITAQQKDSQGDLIPFVAFNEGTVVGKNAEFLLQGLVLYIEQVVVWFDPFF